MKKGKCFGVSVGPGDPRLMTIKSRDIIDRADIIFLPSAPKENCRVYQIIKSGMPEISEDKYACVETAGMADPETQSKRYDILAENVAKYLDEGKDVAFPALGEVNLYSTYAYVFKRLKKLGYECENISGISSVQETCNRLLISLAEGKEQVHIFPDTDNIKEKLLMPGTKVFMKPKGDLDDTINTIIDFSKEHEGVSAYGISNCGTPNEIKADSVDDLRLLNGYMTVIIVKS